MLVDKNLDAMCKLVSKKRDFKILLNEIFGSDFKVFSKFTVTVKGFHIFF